MFQKGTFIGSKKLIILGIEYFFTEILGAISKSDLIPLMCSDRLSDKLKKVYYRSITFTANGILRQNIL